MKNGSTAPLLDLQKTLLPKLWYGEVLVTCWLTTTHGPCHPSLNGFTLIIPWATAFRMGMMSTVIFTKPSPYYSALGGPESCGDRQLTRCREATAPDTTAGYFSAKVSGRLPGRRRTTHEATMCLRWHNLRCR